MMKRWLAYGLITALLLPMGSSIISTAKEANKNKTEELPAIYITTDSGKAVTKKVYEGAQMVMTLPERYEEYLTEYSMGTGGAIQMRCRGNSTFETGPNRLGDSGKFSYKIKLEKKANLLGMGESRHWVLIANFYDVTNLRNKLVYDLSGAMGLSYTQSRWVTVYLNGEYKGIYTLCESIRIDEGRVEITDWEERAETVAKRIAKEEMLSDAAKEDLIESMQNDLSWVTTGKFGKYDVSKYCDMSQLNIDSGYLLEYDQRQDGDTSKFTTGMGVKMQLDSPSALDTNPEMFAYVKNLIADLEEAFTSETFCTNEGVHYSEFVDMQSLVDYFIIFHLFKNIEFGHLSIYLYIEDGMIYFGPAWDFDGSAGNQVTLWPDWIKYDQWFYMNGRAEWWKELCGDPYFVVQVEERWQELRPLLDVYMESLPVWKSYIQKEADRNFKHFGAPKNWYITDAECLSFNLEYKTLVNWLEQRIAWLDEQWSLRDPNMEDRGLQSSEKMTMELTYSDGTQLAEDRLTVSGCKSDYLYSMDNKSNLVLTITTKHTTHRQVAIYINGKYYKTETLNLDTPAQFTIPYTKLNDEPGAVNVIYAVGFNDTSYYRATYTTVRMSEKTVKRGDCVARVGDDYLITAFGGTVTLPEINVHAPGFEAVGWTDGEKLYPEGTECVLRKSINLWIDWERTDLLTELEIKPGKAYVGSPVTPTPPSVEEPSGVDQIASKRNSYWWTLLLAVPVVAAGGVAGGVYYVRKRKKKS
ncbi:MAG: CotH kinase family protein [Clostridia bacterium]|nr:CotH kinase family protein [Clostridia bacterium]